MSEEDISDLEDSNEDDSIIGAPGSKIQAWVPSEGYEQAPLEAEEV